MYYPFKIPYFIQRIFPRYLWRVTGTEKVIYLTFDDGPNPIITPWILTLLKEYRAQATFFCLGKKMEVAPQLTQDIVDQGHRLANHTYSHLKAYVTQDTAYLADVEKATKLIKKIKPLNPEKTEPVLFRPPYGKIKNSQAKKLIDKGYRIVMWEVLSGDFDPDLSAEKSLQKLLKHTQSGSIVVFHDSRKAKNTLQNVLPKALAHWNQQGFIFKSL